MKVFKWFDNNLEKVFVQTLFFSILSLVTLQVVLRFGFNSGFAWSEELARFLFIWLMYFAFSYITLQNKHIKVTFLIDKLSEKSQKLSYLFVDILCFLFTGFLFIATIKVCQSIMLYGDKAVTINVTMNIVYGAGLIGYLLMSYRYIQHIWWKVRNFQTDLNSFLYFRIDD